MLLRQAVTFGLEERRAMQRELAAAEERVLMATASNASSSMGMDPSMAAFLNKPMRQGPISKPKFK